ncbi:hypothetical protein SAMN05421770_107116 [Granulicella rosea]|uniref:Uncharacterized protein n=1 Tax=Granulicella rosea TaxID=474952 RepID=A0A239LL79_9BACT|nr:hypothetical protein [Granulicella rosea]SNT31221.1 hypothetical protein SAMN05421770_107115 [Granulicella rosea]SNT31236.1 hypothetical protein SAMN05421770_107116 [Granulicella rosea]
MKTTIRLAVAALVLTGFAATTQASTSKTTVQPKVSAMPVPSCAPDGQNSCGL